MRAFMRWVVGLALFCGAAGASAQVCGNGVREGAEQCDDGNLRSSDACSGGCRVELAQRVNSLAMVFTTNATCPQNRFGSAFVSSLARDQINNALAAGVQDGSISLVIPFDPLGASILNTTPVLPGATAYDGNNDLDWWYRVSFADLDADGVPLQHLPSSSAGGMLTVGPGSADLGLNIGGSPTVLSASSILFTATFGANQPLTLSSGLPPGHLPSENMAPSLTGPGSLTGGAMCANVSAESLSTTPISPQFATGGSTPCSQGYSASSSLLDVVVGGCNFIIQLIQPTQPDTSDPDAPVAGTGAPYTLSANAQRHVDTCRDSSNAIVPLADCLRAAAYSTSFTLTTDRVIPRTPAALVFADGFE
jgi:cysteine-rich repeat protein